ncbi:MAG: (2Fe-2S)-binding protein [Pseudomonadota bacterium]
MCLITMSYMYVCLCNAVTDRQITAAIGRGAQDVTDVVRELGVGTNCGTCLEYAQELIESHKQGTTVSQVDGSSAHYYPAP